MDRRGCDVSEALVVRAAAEDLAAEVEYKKPDRCIRRGASATRRPESGAGSGSPDADSPRRIRAHRVAADADRGGRVPCGSIRRRLREDGGSLSPFKALR